MTSFLGMLLIFAYSSPDASSEECQKMASFVVKTLL